MISLSRIKSLFDLEQGSYRVGTLVYSRAGLVALFGWLLWGDFIFTLMEAVMPALLPLLLKIHGASNREIIIIVTTLHMVMNAALNPVISYQSDRLRSRWGRRRPFIVISTPFIVLFLGAIPFAPEITRHIVSIGLVAKLLSFGPIAPLILVFGILVSGFQLFNMFVSSVYYYLIPDVVPRELVGRFLGLFRIFGAAAGMVFNYFLFGIAEQHMKLIFVTIALLYGIFILLMCARVKEGDYPAVIDDAPQEHWWSGIRKYVKECYGHSYYLWIFLTYSAIGWGLASNVFAIFFFREGLGFSLELFGKATAFCGGIFMVLAFPFGVVLDRWGPHKTLITGYCLLTAFSVLMFFSANGEFSGLIWLVVRGLALALCSMALGRWAIEVYPRERYGQFGSAGALFSSLGGIILGPLCGWWMDSVKVYRFYLLWSALFTAIGIVSSVIVYRKWKTLGGPNNYRAP